MMRAIRDKGEWQGEEVGLGRCVREHPHRSRGREDVIRCVLEEGKPGKGITFEM